MTTHEIVDPELKTPHNSLVALLKKSSDGREVFVVDLAAKTCFATNDRELLADIIDHNLTIMADAKADLEHWQISPSPHLRLACLSTIKKLIAKHHQDGISLPDFSSPDHAMEWITKSVGEVFDRIEKYEMSSLVALECQVIPAVMAMERQGVPFDLSRWQNTLTDIARETDSLKRKLDDILPNDNGFLLFGQEPVDLNNPNAVKAALEKVLDTKLSGTSQSSLKDYDHEAVKLVLRYREHARMLSNYGDSFLEKIKDDRMRGHFTPISSASGRFACHDVNLLALPNDEKFQACLKPKDPYVITHFDYSGFELRILAALSGDETLIRIFGDEQDIHSMVAQEIFGVTVNKNENAHLRDQAKVLNFGLIYGMGEQALSRQLKISKSEAHDMLNNYFKRFHRVHDFLTSLEHTAKTQGYVTTALGRRAYFTNSDDAGQIGRLARNIPIQGTGADIAKLALCRVYKNLRASGLDAHVINLVHDEIVIEAHSDHSDETARIVMAEMHAAFSALCPSVASAVSSS